MPERPLKIRWQTLRSLACAGGVVLLSLGVSAPLALGEISFTTTPTEQQANTAAAASPIVFDAEDTVPLGVAEPKVTFATNALDKRALAAEKLSKRLEGQRELSIEAAARIQSRITALQELLDEAQGDEEQLRQAIQARMLRQYKDGESANIVFLLTGDASDVLDRARTLQDVSGRDARMLDEYAVTIERIEQLELALEDVSDIYSERTERLTHRIERLGQTVSDARTAHVEDEVPVADDAEGEAAANEAAKNGAWYVMGGAFQSQLFLPGFGGSGYDGGTRTPARRATSAQVGQLFAMMQQGLIDLDSSGIADISSYQIDGRVLGAMMGAAQAFGHIKITSLKSDHGIYTASGNISAHSVGCAMDIGTIGSTYITPGSQVEGGEVWRAVNYFAQLQGDLAPHQVISLFSLGGPTLAMGDHGDHIHVGYAC